jgi:N-acetylglucosamine kinase-like BadF-type ATPase
MARSRDEGEPATALAKLIPQALACPDWDELVERIMKAPDAVFPAAFPTVLVAADAGDRAAQDILRAAATALASLAATVTRRLAITDQEFPLVKCGGLFGHSAIFDAQVDAALAVGLPRARISRLEVSPAVGAARMAARLAQGSARAETATG